MCLAPGHSGDERNPVCVPSLSRHHLNHFGTILRVIIYFKSGPVSVMCEAQIEYPRGLCFAQDGGAIEEFVCLVST